MLHLFIKKLQKITFSHKSSFIIYNLEKRIIITKLNIVRSVVFTLEVEFFTMDTCSSFYNITIHGNFRPHLNTLGTGGQTWLLHTTCIFSSRLNCEKNLINFYFLFRLFRLFVRVYSIIYYIYFYHIEVFKCPIFIEYRFFWFDSFIIIIRTRIGLIQFTNITCPHPFYVPK